MADRVYPSARPNLNPPQSASNGAAGAAGAAGSQPSFPATKGQLYNRPIYRPQPPAKRRRSRRGLCYSCCCWIVLVIVVLILLAAIAGGIFYAIYRPRRPTFSVSSIRLSALNVSASNQLTSRLDLAVTARNPNRKVVFLYDPISIAVTSNGVDIGDGSFPAFVHDTMNTTVMRATAASTEQSVDPSVAADLTKGNIQLEIDLETKAGVKVGKLKTKKIRIKVRCEGIEIAAPKGKNAAVASTPDASCKVELRIKIWKWTI
ncbi:hypothetical protein AXF42_Ash005528 [Apostasia shenzhenica]|uniref:Late embryogenesis abundant protein LEA-2 subgroup domain-containing protein n=1 Tax=Apostasia shenzhenica TaxID=1088818 RepID=A0A2I0B757_9ASPA|nr:hypothetical protein AXF42_Ash005528 [Apostasia shenzhenica]